MIRWLFFAAAAVSLVFSSASAGTFKLAAYPSNDPEKIIPPMQALADYLASETGDGFEVVITRDYDQLSSRIAERSVDLAWLNPVNYIRTKLRQPGLRYIATYMEMSAATGEVTPFYHAVIVTMESSGIRSLEDARNMRFAFTDKGSTSGYFYPGMMLRKKGIDPETYFSKVFFLKKHDRVIEALVHGSVDLGAVSDGTFLNAQKKYGDRLRVVDKSLPIPLDALVSPDHVALEKADAFRAALVRFPKNHPFFLLMKKHLGWDAAGFAVKNDAFYNSMREAMQ